MLRPIQSRAIDLLLVLPSVNAVARELDISSGSIRNWLRDDKEFVAELNAKRRFLHKQNMELLQEVQRKAIERVNKALDNEDDDIAVRAARLLMEHSHPSHFAKEDMADAELDENLSVPDAGEGGKAEVEERGTGNESGPTLPEGPD